MIRTGQAPDAGPHLARARFLGATGRPARAAIAYSRALRLEPGELSHLGDLAEALLNLGLCGSCDG